jgi:hypothetical protein
MDFRLLPDATVAMLADVDTGSCGGDKAKNFGVDQAVIKDHIGRLEPIPAAEG